MSARRRAKKRRREERKKMALEKRDASVNRPNKFRDGVIPSGKCLFRIVVRIARITLDDAQKIAQGLVKFWDDTDLTWEFFQIGATEGCAMYDFTPAFPWTPEKDMESRQDAARLTANIIWHALGDYGKEPLRIKAAPFGRFGPETEVYILDDSVYWTDHFPYEEEMGVMLGEGKEEGVEVWGDEVVI